jgi:hypothetical protein
MTFTSIRSTSGSPRLLAAAMAGLALIGTGPAWAQSVAATEAAAESEEGDTATARSGGRGQIWDSRSEATASDNTVGRIGGRIRVGDVTLGRDPNGDMDDDGDGLGDADAADEAPRTKDDAGNALNSRAVDGSGPNAASSQ